MEKVVLVALFPLAIVLCVAGQEKTASQSGNIQTVDYCALRKDPDLYNGKTIRVSGIYARGFELSAFYSKACFHRSYYALHETWVDNFFQARICSDKDTAAIVKTFLSGK